MKRTIFRLLTVVAFIGLALSCGGGGGDDDGDEAYNFAGRWVYTWTISTSTIPNIPIGKKYQDVMVIAQDGNNITVKYESTGDTLIMKGTCDPTAKTFSATGVSTGTYAGVRNDTSGTGIDSDSMSGNETISANGRSAAGPWTADLVTRSIATSAPGTLAGDMATLLQKTIH